MLTIYQEMLVDMIDHIEDKEAKAKFIRKKMEKGNKNTLSLQNSYKFKDIMKQFEIQKPITIHDLQIEIKQIRVQIEELKVFAQNMNSRIQNIENQEISLINQTTDEFDNFVNSITIVEKQR